MTRKEFVTKATVSLAESYSPGEAKALAVRILSHFLGLSDYEFSVEPNVPIPKSGLDRLYNALQELEASRPVQYVIGEETFMGRRFKVSESVLIPRPETEQLCRIIIDDCRKQGYSTMKIVDACTGSGCIAYTLAAAFPKAEVLAFDIDEDALEVAKSQSVFLDEAERQPLTNIPEFFRADILAGPSDSQLAVEDADILVSNPPYVCESEKDFMSPNVLDYEPELALFVPDNDPLRFYKALAVWAAGILNPGGKCYFEINEAYGSKIRRLYEEKGFSNVEILQDFRGKDRFVYFEKWF